MIYDDRIIEEVKRRTSLIELVSERTSVRQSGRNFQACCPFHNEKTPSFHINEDEGLYYCFGCGKKGNTFTFVMDTKSLSFPEALRFLAQRSGVSLPEETKTSSRRTVPSGDRNVLRRVIAEVAQLYEDSLWNKGSEARDFLHKRRISEYTAKRFRLGYAESNRSNEGLAQNVYVRLKSSLGISPKDVTDALTTLGLLRKRTSGALGELFWDRVMFPITKSDSSPLAFGGRILVPHETSPKYINSPESPVFEKRRSFYGLGQGFSAAQKAKHVYIVEGYLDVISFSQLGIDNTLAVCGTALTEDHAKILTRFVNKVTLIFDGDGAGRAAAAKSYVPFLNSGIEVVPVILDAGDDPDTLTYDRTESDVRSILTDKETSLLQLYIETMAGQLRGLERGVSVPVSSLNAAEAGKISEELARVLSSVKNPVEREFRIREASSLLGVTEAAFQGLVRNYKSEFAKKGVVSDSQRTEVAERPIASSSQSVQMPIVDVPSSRRMSILRRQLLVSLIVEPSLLCSSSVRSQIAVLGTQDPRVLMLTKRLVKNGSDVHALISDTSDIQVIQGLSTLVSCDEEVKQSLLALFQGILTECSLISEGLIEEALHQLSVNEVAFTDTSNKMRNKKRLESEFSDVVDRVKVNDELDSLRVKELEETNSESRLLLAQEKLMRKRSISKVAK